VPLTEELLARSTDGDIRATGELASFASSLLLLRGVRVMDFSTILHRQPLVQVLTGSHYVRTRPGMEVGDANNGWPLHETLDNLIARKLGGKPVVFECVTPDTMTSFRNGDNAGDRAQENPVYRQPSAAFKQLFTKVVGDAKAQAASRQFATDAVLDDLKSLRNDKRLSAADVQRLTQHFDAMNQLEIKLSCDPPLLSDPRMAAITESDNLKPDDPSRSIWESSGDYNRHTETVANAFLEMAALGASCGAFRAGSVVMPAPTNFDHSTVFEPGTDDFEKGFTGHYHPISHRAFASYNPEKMKVEDDDDGTGGLAAVNAHHRIDRWHGRQFARLLGRLREFGVLDQGITMWSNEIGHGNHWSYDMPYILAGSAGGKLTTGYYLDLQKEDVSPDDYSQDDLHLKDAIMAKQTPCSMVLNTVGAALGLTSDDGQPLHDFGGHQRRGDNELNPSPMERVTGNLSDLLTLT
ncbi:MAG: DUF1552 domain-containing protein, partial [Myxococcales bacterium]